MLRNAKTKGKSLGRPRVFVDAERVVELRSLGRSWPQIARELRVGVGTAYRVHQEFSKKLASRFLSGIPNSEAAAAD